MANRAVQCRLLLLVVIIQSPDACWRYPEHVQEVKAGSDPPDLHSFIEYNVSMC